MKRISLSLLAASSVLTSFAMNNDGNAAKKIRMTHEAEALALNALLALDTPGKSAAQDNHNGQTANNTNNSPHATPAALALASADHQRVPEANTTNRYLCDVCGRTFDYQSELAFHHDMQHPYTGPDSHRCTVPGCSTTYRYKTEGGLSKHMKQAHPEKCTIKFDTYPTQKAQPLSYKCGIIPNCPYSPIGGYATQEQVWEHIRQEHSAQYAALTGNNNNRANNNNPANAEASKDHYCTVPGCPRPNYRFSTSYALQSHIETKHPKHANRQK